MVPQYTWRGIKKGTKKRYLQLRGDLQRKEKDNAAMQAGPFIAN